MKAGNATGPAATSRWAEAWPDALAFALGLASAWWGRWNTTDLVWSLWLSSLVLGYALILWLQAEPLREAWVNMRADKSDLGGPVAKAAVLAITAGMTLFGVLFFTVHFGGFHFGHSIFLNMFFPVGGERPKELVDFAV